MHEVREGMLRGRPVCVCRLRELLQGMLLRGGARHRESGGGKGQKSVVLRSEA
jgi:hypothetical protein